jgi:hypothetical protein
MRSSNREPARPYLICFAIGLGLGIAAAPYAYGGYGYGYPYYGGYDSYAYADATWFVGGRRGDLA